jgi:Ca-activated chloride channel family protein
VAVGADTAGIDALVDGRVQRSKTAAALLEANELVEHGKVEEARRTLANRQQEIAAAAATATAAAAVPPPRRADVDSDFAGQASAVSTAAAALAAPRPAATSRAVRANQEKANALFR